jgi:transposase
MRAYRFALDLTPVQQRAVLAHAGAARKAHNWALARVKAVMDQRAAERSYGLADDPLTPAIGWTLPALRKAWNQAKDGVAPWWREVSKEAFNTGLDALARGLKNWGDSRTGTRAGRRVGFPRYKAKHRSTPSVRFTTGAIRVEPDRKHEVLPRLGRLKLHECARTLARRIEAGTARILSATVRRDGRRWFVAVTVEVERTVHHPVRPQSVVLDRDVNAARNLAALATAAAMQPAGSGPVAGRGADRKTHPRGQVAMKRLPGTASAGKTGTVPPQGGTTNHVPTKAH